MKTRHLSIGGWILCALAAFAPALGAQQMNYQGRLTDASGNPLQDGQYTLTFEIYDAPEGGARVWGPFVYDGDSASGHAAKADLVNGRFNVIVGPNDTATPARPLSGAFGGPRFLQITVASNPPLLPRQQILAAPEALHAVNADHAVLADGINGSLNITGAFSVGGNAGFANDLSITGKLSFGSVKRQMVNLYGTNFGIGVQDGAQYFRTENGFAWFRNGSHTNTQSHPGTGGKAMMTMDSTNGLFIYGETNALATVTFINTNKGNLGSHAGWGATGDWYLRSNTNIGWVYIQDVGGHTKVGGDLTVGSTITASGGIYSPGWVGIGGGGDFPLHVYSKRNFNYNQWVGDLRNYNGGVYQHVSTAEDYSIVSDGAVWGPTFQATSDRRIKSIDGASNTAKDLETVQKLKVTDYHYIDPHVNGGRAQKGFIAQEVQQVIPEAVSSGPGFIPNIFSAASEIQFDSAKQSLTVSLSKAHDLKPGDKVRLLSENDGSLELSVESIKSDRTFVVAQCEKNPGRVFVFGKHIPDLLNLNYDRIFSTGIGAIQELTKRVKDLEERQQRFAELERKARRVEALEEELSDLRKLVTRLAQAQRVNTDNSLAAK